MKGRYGTLGLDVSAPYNICRSDLGTTPNVDSLIKWAQDAGKATGIFFFIDSLNSSKHICYILFSYLGFVTTTRVTHATPAGLYAHTANRDWECDSQVPLANRHECKDIARQLIEDEPGRNIKVMFFFVHFFFSYRDGTFKTRMVFCFCFFRCFVCLLFFHVDYSGWRKTSFRSCQR